MIKKSKFVSGITRVTEVKLGALTIYRREDRDKDDSSLDIFGINISRRSKEKDKYGKTYRRTFLSKVFEQKRFESSNAIDGTLTNYLFGLAISKKHFFQDNHPDLSVLKNQPVVFPEFDSPVVSIIIPAFNQYGYTIQCLGSILKARDDTPYEIIIADDNSNDDTQNIGNFFRNIRISRSTENQGYIGNCNKATSIAKGKYLYFLNNDTIVKENWLSELVRAFELRPNAGVIGSKILNADGSLQECGVLICTDGQVL